MSVSVKNNSSKEEHMWESQIPKHQIITISVVITIRFIRSNSMCVYVCMCVYTYIYIYIFVLMYVYVYVCMYICIYICMYIYIYI